MQKRYDAYNAKIPGLVAKRVATGKHILVMDMRSVKGQYIGSGKITLLIIDCFCAEMQSLFCLVSKSAQSRQQTANSKLDKIHPTDQGYQRIADFWFSGIQQADSKGWIKPPVAVQNIHPAHPLCIPNLSKRVNSQFVPGEHSGHYCLNPPKWTKTGSNGRISHGVGKNGPAQFKKNWIKKSRAGPGIDKKGQGQVK